MQELMVHIFPVIFQSE